MTNLSAKQKFLDNMFASEQEFSSPQSTASALLETLGPPAEEGPADSKVAQNVSFRFANSHPSLGYQPDQGAYVGTECACWTSGDDWYLEVEFTEI
ncbi:hypothetical protein [Janthinobacterium sp. LB3P118]|uniref:hypothetical protein n=1 Tax=Janthinobacterium sp. LB3P118 TaxID=3424195 RepID=UPI003F22A747